MFTLPPSVRIYLAPGATDLRKSFNGLECAARDVLGQDPLTHGYPVGYTTPKM